MTALSSFRIIVLLTWLTFQSVCVNADNIRIAVASNFYNTLIKLIDELSRNSETRFDVIPGATGVLYAQIENGAPFDIFMAADIARPALLEDHGRIAEGSRKTYAIGLLVIWVPGSILPVDEHFLTGYRGTLAIANPDIAPYGIAALKLMNNMELSEVILVRGNNVGQTYQLVETGNASAGVVALSQVLQRTINSNDFWQVDQRYYEPIEQQMVILNSSPGSREFDTFLASAAAVQILRNDGYQLSAEKLSTQELSTQKLSTQERGTTVKEIMGDTKR